ADRRLVETRAAWTISTGCWPALRRPELSVFSSIRYTSVISLGRQFDRLKRRGHARPSPYSRNPRNRELAPGSGAVSGPRAEPAGVPAARARGGARRRQPLARAGQVSLDPVFKS